MSDGVLPRRIAVELLLIEEDETPEKRYIIGQPQLNGGVYKFYDYPNEGHFYADKELWKRMRIGFPVLVIDTNRN